MLQGTSVLHRGAMIGSVFWGALLLLFLETAATASSLQDKKIDSQQLREERHGEDMHDDHSLLLNKSPTNIFTPLASVRGAPHDFDKRRGGPEVAQALRVLQSTCTAGDSFTITSSAFPSAEGCYSSLGSVSNDGNVVYDSDPFAVASLQIFNLTSGEVLVSFWYMVEVATNDSIIAYNCISEENSTALPHPADATWICNVNGDGQYEPATSSEFSTTCGCSTTDSITTDDIESDAATCDDGESFTITSPVVPDLTGCYFDTGEFLEGEVVYSETGTITDEQILLHAMVDDENDLEGFRFASTMVEEFTHLAFILHLSHRTVQDDGTGLQEIRWVVGTFGETPDCYSFDEATDTHPAEVETWICPSYSSDEAVTTEQFSVSCGCSSDADGDGEEADRSSLSTPVSTSISFGVGFVSATVLLAGL